MTKEQINKAFAQIFQSNIAIFKHFKNRECIPKEELIKLTMESFSITSDEATKLIMKLIDAEILVETAEVITPNSGLYDVINQYLMGVFNVSEEDLTEEIEQLKAELTSKDQAINSLAEELDSVNKATALKEADVKELAAELDRAKELSEVNTKEIESLRYELSSKSQQIQDLTNDLLTKDMIVKGIRPFDSKTGKEITYKAAKQPLINDFKVPGIYNIGSRTKDICDKETATKENVSALNKGLSFIKSLKNKQSEEIKEEVANTLTEVFNPNNPKYANLTGIQKLIIYLSIYPDISKESKKNVLNACNNGLDAETIIELMETDKELFSIDYFDYLVEVAENLAEAEKMVEVSKRLLLGEWYITADVNGKLTKFYLVSEDQLKNPTVAPVIEPNDIPSSPEDESSDSSEPKNIEEIDGKMVDTSTGEILEEPLDEMNWDEEINSEELPPEDVDISIDDAGNIQETVSNLDALDVSTSDDSGEGDIPFGNEPKKEIRIQCIATPEGLESLGSDVVKSLIPSDSISTTYSDIELQLAKEEQIYRILYLEAQATDVNDYGRYSNRNRVYFEDTA